MLLRASFPAVLILVATPVPCATAMAGPSVGPAPLNRPTIDTPEGPVSQQMRDGTMAFVEACRAWTRPLPLPSVPLSVPHRAPATTEQFNLCQMAMHPDQFRAAFRFYTILAAWGLLLSMAVAAYLFVRLGRFGWRYTRQRKLSSSSALCGRRTFVHGDQQVKTKN